MRLQNLQDAPPQGAAGPASEERTGAMVPAVFRLGIGEYWVLLREGDDPTALE